MAGFLGSLLAARWRPGDPVGEGAPLHDAYVQATTMTFLGIVACQVGTAFAARTERASLAPSASPPTACCSGASPSSSRCRRPS